MFPEHLISKAQSLLAACNASGKTIVTAESCTGGLVAALLTEIPGSSSVFDRGFVTYSNNAKHFLLKVSEELLQACGAVSGEVAKAMAEGALHNSNADVSIAITGIAGPGGGTEEKPVGLVHISVAVASKVRAEECRFQGSRQDIRLAAVEKALDLALASVS